MKNIRDFTLEELEILVKDLGEPPYRAHQIFHWITCKGAQSFHEMTNLPNALRKKLSENFSLSLPEVLEIKEDLDGTIKLAFLLEDEEVIESVILPERDHFTLCVSTQVGCAMGCKFCLTGKMGFKRNLKVFEIISQVVWAKRFLKNRGEELPLRNIVFMGMGEPLANLRNLIKALKILAHPMGFNFSRKRLTVSTVGLIKEIEILGREFPVALAVSLHAPTDEIRKTLIPIAYKYSIKEILQVVKRFPRIKNGRTTIEYLLLKDLTDTSFCAEKLVELFKGLPIKINLIPFNPHPELPFERPSEKRMEEFQKFLLSHGILTTIRKSKGLKISAACGHLRAEIQKYLFPNSMNKKTTIRTG
ncbi:MAG: 23S rRNA (adenine(2503)-C(2))-methyltransferase RlmN [Thermodesulfobacteriaceae bacterium]|nr:23S rRNA (adenine(2503)-C(2))-methyltransferase RlmN [Thermodesulfobacteriaceae bacterium]MCX8041825.1 23S rRNA (adenine(2503)-C(2))-methyltransferase RlmN [Thermodesulfobacteriaceae bacterium]MDW8135296.1 23S rRNA (adenine(2503)-C(2))-methyltransferase RlmN [Thermodesulfobacterium sp.]